MECKTFYFNALRTCCYVVSDQTGDCIIIDPGCYRQTEEQRLATYIRSNNLTPRYIVNTHCHFDHLMGLAFLRQTYQIPFRTHPLEAGMLKKASSHAILFGFSMIAPGTDFSPLYDGEKLSFGTSSLKVIHTPGHSPGSVCLYGDQERMLFTGDLLFAGSVGRTDLPGGDYDQLMDSLSRKIMPLPAYTLIFPGHGPTSSLERELAGNPYLQHL
ncbi:MAG TPA: MBL fold metallo-hydrolase [Bacteroidales bacterium]|nr:MBL fold metallo-hydrolase [Bacteroidales bacterium]HQN81741.1 MBL fold metallo-hydrolase [Bacteroidales bacterium]HQP64011.1 MBL fold metallo-hydrolase [Bacteroidales bacterium]